MEPPVFSHAPCDLSNPADLTPPWVDALPHGDRPRLQRLYAGLLQLDRNPALVSLPRHTALVTELARLVAAVLDADTLTSAVPLLFRHAGVECNCVVFEFTQRTQYLAERFLLGAHFGDTGGPAHPSHDTVPDGEHHLRAECVRQITGLLNLALEWAARRWTDVAAPASPNAPHLRQLLAWVRAYGLWNLARMQIGARILEAGSGDDEPETSSARLRLLLSGLDALVEAQRTLPAQPLVLGGGVLELVPCTRLPLEFNVDVLTVKELGAHAERLAAEMNPRVTDPWYMGLTSHLLHLWADTRAAMGEHGWAVALVRVLARRSDAHPRLERWEQLNRRVLIQVVPSTPDVKQALQQMLGCPKALRRGTDPLSGAEAFRLMEE